jgi:hypothetical protein
MKVILVLLLASMLPVFLSSESQAEDKAQIRPGMVGGTPQPNAPAQPQNPSQQPSPSAPGVIFTYPNNGPTKGSCSRDGKPVPC